MENREQVTKMLLNILVGKEPVPVKSLDPGLEGVSKFAAETTRLSAKEVHPYIRYMKEKGWIAFDHIQGNFYLVVTPRGKKHWKKQQIPQELPKELLKESKWLIVMFDIPNKHKTARDKFRRQLLSWGFAKVMESTFVTPYDWRKYVEDFRMLHGIAPYVRLIESNVIEREAELNKQFALV